MEKTAFSKEKAVFSGHGCFYARTERRCISGPATETYLS